MIKPNLHLKGYLKRWYLIPKNPWFNIYLHCFEGDDRDRHRHNHPWWSLSILLKGGLREVFVRDIWEKVPRKRVIRKWTPYVRTPAMFHSMYLTTPTAWTLFITGPKIQQWGFTFPTPHEFMPYQEYKATHGDYLQ